MTRFLLAFPLFAVSALAQLVPGDQPLPRTAAPPVVFLNGYQAICFTSTFEGTFGQSDVILQQDGRVSVFFNNCSVSGKPSIEALGQQFGKFLEGLRYTDGQMVPQVDVVAHSMGGLIVRSYVAGKQETPGLFAPPSSVHLRRIVFLATPHFGTTVTLGFSLDPQTQELTTGSRFLFDLNTWNQGTDDLRGIDALSLLGDQGNGLFGQPRRSSDGVTPLTSGSIELAASDHTRILPYCHVGGVAETLGQFCTDGVPGIAKLTSSTQDVARAMLSFLDGGNDWRNIGQAPSQNSFLQANGGLYVAWKTAGDQWNMIQSASISTGQPAAMTVQDNQIAYRELVTAGPGTLTLQGSGGTAQRTVVTPAATTTPVVVKDGPVIVRIFPSAGVVAPLALAPGMLISVYGNNLDQGSVFVNDQPVTTSYVSATQINARLPVTLAAGAPKVTVRTPQGEHTVTALVEPAVPAVFTLDGSGRGAAAALHGVTYAVVTQDNPLRTGEVVSLYLTGLGNTGIAALPGVTVGGASCAAEYAGPAPGFPGLDQINCRIPAEISTGPAVPVTVSAAGHTSNLVTLAVQ